VDAFSVEHRIGADLAQGERLPSTLIDTTDRATRGIGRSRWQAAPVETRWFRRRWEEPRGDSFDSWGAATYFFETGEDGRPTRQIEVYDAGPTRRYGPGRTEDEFGHLGCATLDGLEDWRPWGISREEFEAAWGQPEEPTRRDMSARSPFRRPHHPDQPERARRSGFGLRG
jgi:hypothetical protein